MISLMWDIKQKGTNQQHKQTCRHRQQYVVARGKEYGGVQKAGAKLKEVKGIKYTVMGEVPDYEW